MIPHLYFQLISHRLIGKNFLELVQSVHLVIDGLRKLEHLTGKIRKTEPADLSMNAGRSENSVVIACVLNSMEPAIAYCNTPEILN